MRRYLLCVYKLLHVLLSFIFKVWILLHWHSKGALLKPLVTPVSYDWFIMIHYVQTPSTSYRHLAHRCYVCDKTCTFHEIVLVSLGLWLFGVGLNTIFRLSMSQNFSANYLLFYHFMFGFSQASYRNIGTAFFFLLQNAFTLPPAPMSTTTEFTWSEWICSFVWPMTGNMTDKWGQIT